MCGRYTFFTEKEIGDIEEILEQIDRDVNRDRFKAGDIHPSEVAPVFVREEGTIRPRLFSWGFPGFKGTQRVINARSETAAEKRLFRSALLHNRCVIPSTGFYEWDQEKRKYLFRSPDMEMLYMAGFYDRFAGEDCFVILTTAANTSVADIHERMPLVLPKMQIGNWLSTGKAADTLLYGASPLLKRNLMP